MANNEQEITPGHPNKDKNEYSFDILTDETVSRGSVANQQSNEHQHSIF